MATQITITDADLAALVQAAKATLAKYDALADKLSAAVPAISNNFDMALESITASITAAQADVERITIAAEKFNVKVF
jgi:methanogenic corrinoid protein MtbC1